MGWPPKKNEAKSLSAAGHVQADKVRALLEAARDAIQRDGWSPATGEVALELTIPAAQAVRMAMLRTSWAEWLTCCRRRSRPMLT